MKQIIKDGNNRYATENVRERSPLKKLKPNIKL